MWATRDGGTALPLVSPFGGGTTAANTTASSAVTFTLTANSGGAPRTATILITAGNLRKVVTITQEGAPPTLEVGPATLTFAFIESGSGNSQNVAITTNYPSWSFSNSNTTDFDVTQSGNTLTVFPKSQNGTSAPLTATITITAGSLTKYVTVTQLVIGSIPAMPTRPLNPAYVGAF
jgi:hypothetical protein